MSHRSCNTCQGSVTYNERHDAFFCPRCNIWTEKACGDPTCQFCAARPSVPPDLLSLVQGGKP